jgi:hypothetical protein
VRRRADARQASRPGHAVITQLRQRLPAETRASGAEEDDVGGLGAEARGGIADLIEIVARARHVQQRQAAALVLTPQPREPVADHREGGLDGDVGKAGCSDVACQRQVDRLLEGHHPLRF